MAVLTPFVPSPTHLVETDRFVTRTWLLFFQNISGRVPNVGTSAQRLAPSTTQQPPPIGALFFETDRQSWYVFTDAGWRFQLGLYRAPLANAPTNLGVLDAGFTYTVEDYADTVVWTGAGWTLQAGAVPPGAQITLTGSLTPGFGWAQADGTGTAVLSIGTTLSTVSVTLPSSAGVWVKK